MDRVRRMAAPALLLVFVLTSAGIGAAATGTAGVPVPAPAAAVGWSVSTLVLSEVMTGGASASDEFVEIANAGAAVADLAGFEIVYVTASGSTVSRKATWAEPRPLDPGQRLLLANASGSFAGLADVAYSGGFAATGGALVLRPVGGAPADAVGWGDASNAFVEGSPAPAPPAGSTIERRPGGAAGNGTDTNDNATDWFVQSAPSPQNLASPPVPAPVPSPTAGPTASPAVTDPPGPTPSTPLGTPTPAPTATSTPTASPAPTATSAPTSTAAPSPTPSPAPTPSLAPTATPSPAPTGTPLAPPSPSASPSGAAVQPIATVRVLLDGTPATIEGTLTTRLGALEEARTAFVQDASGGIALYLDAAPVEPWPAGTVVRATGVTGSRFGQVVLRLAATDLAHLGATTSPTPLVLATGSIDESVEGLRVEVAGMTIGSPSALADGTGLWVDDGSGQVRAIVSPEALAGSSLPGGTLVRLRGPVGQRDSSGTGIGGYRIHVTEPGDLEVVEPPVPSAAPSPTPPVTPAPTPSPSPTGSFPPPTAPPTATPAPGTVPSIAAARALPIGTRVTVSGVVTAQVGRLGTPPLIAVQDATGGIAVRLPDEAPHPSLGARVTATGRLHDPYGQLEVRPVATDLAVAAVEAVPAPLAVDGAALGEATEGWLVVVEGVVAGRPQRSSSGDVTIAAKTRDGVTIRIAADSTSGVDRDAVTDGRSYRLVGVVGQRATAKGRVDGYRVWLRSSADITPLAAATSSSAPASGATSAPGPAVLTIARALLVREGDVRVEAVVTADATLLDTTGRRIVIEDGSAAVEVLVPAGAPAPSIGTRVAVVGTVGRAYGAPRLAAAIVDTLGTGGSRPPLELRSAPGPAHEWRLARLSGTIVDVTRMGSRWRAELAVAGARVPVAGMTGAGIPSTLLAEGRRATVVGIVRRAHPSATARRFAIVPRSPPAHSIGPAESVASGSRGGSAREPDAGVPSSAGPLDADLADLEQRVGEVVRVGGLVVELASDGFELDDGTAVGSVVLVGEASAYLPLIEPGDALNATGRVERRDDAIVVRVTDPAGIARVGELTAPAPAAEGTVPPRPSAAADPPRAAALGDPFGLGGPGTAGLAWLVLVSMASLAVTLLRRQRTHRRLLARVAARVAAVAGEGGAAPPDGAREAPPRAPG